ncbi:E3 ubiquitin-protein ligase RBBP6-like [Gouania willdenowi]|nr:E3 ubiquitin-protein ligase RBBP6-like [Gouania willdenowi]
MSYIHYKFVSKMEQKTITFNGLHISLTELKKRIMAQENLKATTCELQISNEKTREKYTNDKVQIPKLSSVIVRRKPIGGVKTGGKMLTLHCSQASVLESIKPESQKRDKERKPAKTSKGILQSVIMKVEPDTKGAMPILTADEAYELIPDQLRCPICNDLMINAVLVPCCGTSYCEECIRTALLDSEDHDCLTCKQSDVSPNSVIVNRVLQTVVTDFENMTGYTVRRRAQVQHPAPPPVYPSPAPYGPPPQPYLPPYTSGPALIPPPIISYQPQSVYASGHPVFNPPWGGPGSQPPSVSLPLPLQMEKATSKLDEVTKGCHKDGQSDPRSPFSRRDGRSYEQRSRPRSGSHSRSYAYRRSGFPQSSFANQGPYRSRSRPRSHVGYRARSPGGQTPPPRELPPYERKGQSSGSQNRWDRERYRQREKNYADSTYFNDYDNQQPSKYHTGHSSRDKERDRMSSLPRNYSVHESARRRDNRTDRRAAPPPPPSSSSFTTKSSYEIPKTNKGKKRKADEPESSPVRDEPMDELPSQNKKSSSASKASGSTAASKAAPSKSSATAAKTSTKCVSKDQTDKAKTEKSSIEKTKTEVDGLKLKSDEMRRSEDAPNSTTPRKEKNNSSRARHSPVKAPPQAAHSLRPPHPPLDDGHHTRIRRDDPQGGGFHSLPPSNQNGLRLVHRPPSPAESRRRMREESWTSRGPPLGKMRRVDGPGMESGANSHSQAPRHPHFHRVPPSDRPGNRPLSGSRELNRSDPNRIPTEALMNTEVKPLRRFKLNRDMGRRGSMK